MREHIIEMALKHPLTVDQMHRLGAGTKKQTSVWVNDMRRQGRLRRVGSLNTGVGRPQSVFCNGWIPKQDNLRHEVMGTEFCMLYPGHFVRGYNVDSKLADIEMTLNEHLYYIEVDCGTMRRNKVLQRWKKYRNFDGTLIVVAVSNPRKGIDSHDRIQELIRWSEGIYDIAVFATLEDIYRDPFGDVYWEPIEAKKTRLKTTKENTDLPPDSPVNELENP